MFHGAAPDNGLVLIFQKVPYGDYLKVFINIHRDHIPFFIPFNGAVLDTKDLRDIGAMDVAVKDTYGISLSRHACRQVCSYGGFAYTALAAHDHDGMPDEG
jgi:hypothetical protein